ncbi:MAG TPA: CBS domain-containing protein [Candidatus Dormibacteraeota bacterium]|nr:CBS domain-containing protein [Candidatus Dormibacteraeota bacterium]
MSALAEIPATQSPAGSATTRPVRDVMRAGVVLVDADMSVRDVARAMRDRGVRHVLAIDLSSELIGMIDEHAVARAWDDPDGRTAAEVMDPDPLIVDPDEPVGNVAQRMLDTATTTVLVAYPPPTEESGVWSEWKERGMPLGTLSVADILARLDELAAVVRGGPARQASPARRAAPWVVLASVLVAIILVIVLIFTYAHGTRHLTNRPGL